VYNVKYCDYCHSSVAEGQRWVREKVYNPRFDSQDPAYHHYHAEPFVGQEGSCWEKHQMEKEVARLSLMRA
jgi:hypothetical protein